MKAQKAIYFLSINLLILSFFLLFPLLLALIFGEKEFKIFLLTLSLVIGSSVIGLYFTREQRHTELGHKEAFFVVTFTWILAAFFGALPYFFAGELSFTDAYFEAMSGFTTTGASVFTEVEHLPKSVLFWRALTQWIGGLGIVVFVLAVLPWVGSGGMQLFKAEVPEVSVDKLKPRIFDTAKLLWSLYTGITAFLVVLYCLGGMQIFDAVCHAFTTISTGGFSTKNTSIAYYHSPLLEVFVTLGMIMGGTNFTLYFGLLRRRLPRFWRSEEFNFYIGSLCVISLTVFLVLLATGYANFWNCLRYAVFQVVSIITTTGYATDDYLKWNYLAQNIILFSMFLGAMAGSTGGGLKSVRVLIIFKQIYKELYKLIHPRAYLKLKLDEKPVSEDILSSIWGFVFLSVMVLIIATLLLSATGVNFLTAFSMVATALNNVGPAFGKAGPTGNFAFVHPFGKWVLSMCMLIGRLEYYTVIILFFPAFWKK